MPSQTEENYLKALFTLENDSGEVNLSDLSSMLSVSKPSVNSMVKSLQKQGFVYYQKYKPLKLSEEGRKIAALILRKHRLTEMYLVEKMGFGWEEVHEIAEQVEHVKSSMFFDRMDELLDHPIIDPHGSPIPDKDGNIILQNNHPLSACISGDKVRLAALEHSSSDFLEFLNSRELKLNTRLEVISLERYDGSMVISYENHPSETLSAKVCEKLMVESLDLID